MWQTPVNLQIKAFWLTPVTPPACLNSLNQCQKFTPKQHQLLLLKLLAITLRAKTLLLFMNTTGSNSPTTYASTSSNPQVVALGNFALFTATLVKTSWSATTSYLEFSGWLCSVN